MKMHLTIILALALTSRLLAQVSPFNNKVDSVKFDNDSSVNASSLDVDLTNLDFEVIAKKETVLLKWSMKENVNNNFDIERSTDNSSWEVIGTVNGRENIDTVDNCFFKDNNLSTNSKVVYYRIKQVSNNEYSNSKSVELFKPLLIKNSPDPEYKDLYIRYYAAKYSEDDINFTNLM